MKINEVEACVGITKKNIRFYEAEGLVTPKRNHENGYRDYDNVDLETLKKIKLFRKLGFPIEEIRKMQKGCLTIADGMERHRISLAREKKNLEQSIQICDDLASKYIRLEELEVDEILAQMNKLESEGTTFQNHYERDRMKNKRAAIIISAIVILWFLGVGGFLLWQTLFVEAVPLLFLIIFETIVIGFVLAVGGVLWMRLKEISSGEIEEAKKY